ncbi:mechanosensitive ion channel family protein [Novilysobacter luteus]|uniref:Small-conductance mechanosensitive channel n=1 Tax=Novilysobacter luteus TaxID=2822368 RepID=A0ABN7R238_9GAMM|nr:mechanosensitive ion channel domain-containing protein [Lysobacter luteus]CAG4972995.1 Small-conductance mechanosensitive channel [Lysobacter luteus]
MPDRSLSWIDYARAGEWSEALIGLGIRFALALMLFLVGRYIVAWLVKLIDRALARTELDATALQFLCKVSTVVLTIVLVLAALQVVGVPMTSMIAVLGAAGLAIGLALKDSLSNIASGVMLVALKPFRVGDVVNINGEGGTVESISIFQTRLRGADNQTIVLPNSLVTSDSIINSTPDVRRRVELVIGIGYDDDIDQARAIIMDIINADNRVLAEPAADVVVYELAENSVNLGVRCHTANGDWFAVKVHLNESIKKAFDAAGISFPYPQRDVHVYRHGADTATAMGDGGAESPRS